METTLRAALDAAMNVGRDLWMLLSTDPVTLPALLMGSAAILGLVLIATPGKRTSVRRPRKDSTRRPAQARSLAASGTPMGEISRRTGLSRDAVAMLLTPIADADSGRKGRPDPAPFSARSPFRRSSPDAGASR